MTNEHHTSEDFDVPQLLLEEIGDICIQDSMRWFPDSFNNLMHHTIALGGEIGEFMNVVKKVDRGSLPPIELDEENVSRQMLLDELTDVLIYTANIYGLLKGNPNLCFQAKRFYNEQRFGPEADDEQ
jgi:NTP pyrophosphatase (non-canonical NTP hydrolase)